MLSYQKFSRRHTKVSSGGVNNFGLLVYSDFLAYMKVYNSVYKSSLSNYNSVSNLVVNVSFEYLFHLAYICISKHFLKDVILFSLRG